jgi:transglutaminase-like putative cysteine protease
LAIACLRANGLAVSFVSGYLATDPPPGKERMSTIDVSVDVAPFDGGVLHA